MALQPSRPGFMIVAAVLFLAMPFLWASATQQAVDKRLVAAGVVIAIVFLVLGAQYRRQLRAGSSAPPSA